MPEPTVATSRKMDFVADKGVRAALRRIGRTEDVQFAPDGRRLVLAGLKTNRLLIVDVDASLDAEKPKLGLTGFVEIESPAFDAPHGLAWVDDDRLIVANRQGCICVIAVPPSSSTGRTIVAEPLCVIGSDGADLVKTPGSLSARPLGLGLIELVVCNNYVDTVTRHLIDCRRNYAVIASDMLFQGRISVPDGIAQSPSGEWLAISGHDDRLVFIFRNDEELDEASLPQAILSFDSYPHGLAFSADERTLLVADAGSPFVHVFRSEDGGWSGRRTPADSIRVLTDAEFRRGNVDPREGGPKGIDLSSDNRLLVATCESRPLAFFDMAGLLGAPDHRPAGPDEAGEVRNVLVRYLSSAAARARQETEALRRAGEFDRQAVHVRQMEIRAMTASLSWRLTAPLRSLNASLGRIRRRR